jgi:hypothetical protein
MFYSKELSHVVKSPIPSTSSQTARSQTTSLLEELLPNTTIPWNAAAHQVSAALSRFEADFTSYFPTLKSTTAAVFLILVDTAPFFNRNMWYNLPVLIKSRTSMTYPIVLHTSLADSIVTRLKQIAEPELISKFYSSYFLIIC